MAQKKENGTTTIFRYAVGNAEGIRCCSTYPHLGYSYKTLQAPEDSGYKFYIDGKEKSFPTAAQVKRFQEQTLKERNSR